MPLTNAEKQRRYRQRAAEALRNQKAGDQHSAEEVATLRARVAVLEEALRGSRNRKSTRSAPGDGKVMELLHSAYRRGAQEARADSDEDEALCDRALQDFEEAPSLSVSDVAGMIAATGVRHWRELFERHRSAAGQTIVRVPAALI